MQRWFIAAAVLGLGLSALPATSHSQDAGLRDSAAKGLRKAVEFFRTQVAVEGGYLWRYSEDLSRREGEDRATATQAWIQNPGTPAIGMAYLSAHERTGDGYYLDAAREAAYALVKGQLRSGGWANYIEFDPGERQRYAYRVNGGNEKGRNVTTLDDDKTQSALRFLMRIDHALGFNDAKIHEAAEYALTSLLRAQYPNGAWPQQFSGPPDPEKFPVKRAAYPTSWSRTFPHVDYKGHYTLNDRALSTMIDTLFEAAQIYSEPKYKAAAEKGGGFLLLAQMPDPQPAWAQQYDAEMHPAWARPFEPPAITGGESQSVLKSLLTLYRETGDQKYLEPIPRAIDWFRRSRLPDGQLARFYELQTNKPLYFTKDYKLVYRDNDLPTHYGFKVSDGIKRIADDYEQLKSATPANLKLPVKAPRPKSPKGLAERAQAVLAALDDRGRWVENGSLRAHGNDDHTRRIIDCRTFIKNVGILSSYLAADKP